MATAKEQQEEGAELMQLLAQKAWESSTFKEQLIKNPVETIELVTGKKVTMFQNKKIAVEDQTDESVIYFNIPAKPDFDDLALTEEQLETISGGTTVVCGAYVLGVCIGYGVCWALSD
ncbi:TOMM propeptide domain-containing protein [Hymenobacter rigui]|uniref:TOMM propeptide domain-containing protein n=1 Tax=Hymenobacter rigui TaxID=334424 RepID=A0A428KMH3_9BACT|nr:TOMM propeptide domain-containing protein [Hymenobacter rigui]RSK47567.1 TOMM propeptide domain-containing protein [Hymenobacter rigui]